MLAAALPAPAQEAEDAPLPPRRVVSINLCADQLLIALADPEQIASLSVNAPDRTLSYYAAAASTYRHSAATAETVIDLNPDLILAGRFTRLSTREMLRNLGYRVVELDIANSIDEAIAQVQEVAAMLGHPERGARLAGLISDARVRATRPQIGATAAVYQRRGFVTGSETLTSDLLAAVGLANVGGELAGTRGGIVPLERLVASPPDFLLMAETDPEAVDQGTALLEHPVLRELFPTSRRIELPERLTVCAGPSLPEALRYLSTEVRRVGL